MPIIVNKIVGTGVAQKAIELQPTMKWGSLNIVASNRGVSATPIKIYISSEETPNDIDIVEPGAFIPANGRYELSCRLIAPGEKVFVDAPADVTVRLEVNLAIED